MPTRVSSRRRTRQITDLGRLGIPSVPMFGRYDYTHACPALAEHAHRGSLEICFLARGRQTYCVGEERFRLAGGEVFMTFPDERHSTGGEPEEKGLLYWMVLLNPAQTGGSLLNLPPEESGLLWRALSAPGRRHFSGGDEMKSHLDALFAQLQAAPTPLSGIAVANRLIAFLLGVAAAREAAATQARGARFRKVFAHIAAHVGEPEELTVERLAAVAGLSPSRFKASFKQEMGIPPAEYALRMRVEEARRRLAVTGGPITRIAFDLGFSSSQYFASVFKRFTRLTPREVRDGGSSLHIDQSVRPPR